MTSETPILIGLSGPSSSGKSTLSRLLVQLFPHSFILHEDDFYKPESEIPVVNGVENWDCPEAIDFESLKRALAYIKENAKLPDDVPYKEDKNDLGTPPVTPDEATSIKEAVIGPDSILEKRLFCLVDGFLLYNDREVTAELDVRLLLRAPFEKLKERREARNGYATLEGFWVDPPGYFEDVVWPGYVKAHKGLFEDGHVDGNLTEDSIRQGIKAASSLDMHMKDLLAWALKEIESAVTKKESN
ncbi:nicotinamide riboside kinase 1 [Myxozyma melibiosi]|uniref:Nicotinamide riboside kinase 1 n=1 Tax=Myxozyma melibiosi TaxID=54550 RepID=A0ABR1FAU9_9ASCO